MKRLLEMNTKNGINFPVLMPQNGYGQGNPLPTLYV